MMVALTDLSAYQAAKSLSDAQLLATGDVNGDGQITNADIQALIGAMAGAESQTTASSATTTVAATPASSATTTATVAISTNVATNLVASTETVSNAVSLTPKKTAKTVRHHAAISNITSKQTAAIDHALETAFDFRHTARWRSLVDRVSHVNERAGAALRNVDTILDRLIASV
jgi:hypothetical protein